MIYRYLFALLFFSPLGRADVSKTDCTPKDKAVLESAQFVAGLNSAALKLLRYDCVNLNVADHASSFVLVAVVATARGPEAQLAWFDRKTFKSAASNLAKTTEPLGVDAFPISVSGSPRLGFALPKLEQNRLGFYVNVQTAPDVTRLIRFDLDMKSKSFHESNNRIWLVEAGVLPKIYQDGDAWRALIVNRSVEL
jgi:hypothetical protein